MGNWFTQNFMGIVGFIRNMLESLSNNVELKIWKNRQKIIFVGICYCIGYPICKLVTGGLESLKSPSGEMSLPYIIEIVLIVFLAFSEFYLRRKNLLSKSVSIGTRLFTLFAYFWSWVELSLTYFDYVINVYSSIFDPNQLEQIVTFVLPIFQFYMGLPGLKIGIVGYSAFFLFFFGIGRNKDTFQFFTRYHYVQAVLFSALFGFQSHLFNIYVRLNLASSEVINYIGATFYSLGLLILVYSFCSVILGVETNFPFMHDAIQYHTGRKENEGIDPLDI
jgi:hypothetical protein